MRIADRDTAGRLALGLAAEAPAVAALAGASKAFGGTVAIRDVSFALRVGQILALLGENGAGKSTCVKLLAGVHRPDSGTVLLDGAPAQLAGPLDARRRGIAVMHQHPALFPDLPVAENVLIGHAPLDRLGRLDRPRIEARVRELLAAVGLDCAPGTILASLRSSEQQLVEVARALSQDARVLIMDEPTASLSRREVDRLFEVVAGLRRRGVAMMFVGHRMEEIERIADRVAVLRDGALVAEDAVATMPRERAVRLMVGRPIADLYPARTGSPGEVVLEVEGLARTGAFEGVSFSVRAGEIVGFAGLVGSGRTEIARVLFGIDRPTAGRIRRGGEEVAFGSAGDAMAEGVAYLSEDRLGQSLIPDVAILANASLPMIDRATQAGLIRTERELGLVRGHLERLRLRFRSYAQPVGTLSGGNQQRLFSGSGVLGSGFTRRARR
jgi:rhamnose transport system ATP-binding protein